VRVIIPSSGNQNSLNAGNKVTINALPEHGIRVYEYPGMSHFKAAIFDTWASIGSANFEKLSLQVNQELNLATSGPDTVQALLEQVFIPDMMLSRETDQPVKVNVSARLTEIAVDELLQSDYSIQIVLLSFGEAEVQEILLGALLLLAVVWLVVRIRQNKAIEQLQATRKPKDSGKFHAVAIKYSENACNAAKALTGRRFLSSAAPRLPLPECDYPNCNCRFVHFTDRRAGRDRRSPFAPATSTGTTGIHEQERRERNDRRKEPDDDFDW
jgi:PLD-like domain